MTKRVAAPRRGVPSLALWRQNRVSLGPWAKDLASVFPVRASVRSHSTNQARDLPSVRSASPENVLLSGILGREHTIKKCSLPEAQMLMDLRYLWEQVAEQRLPINTFAFKSKFWHRT